MSALDVAEGTGISRGTARRYLEYLERQGRAALELRYGAAGRPEHRYRLVERADIDAAKLPSPPPSPRGRGGFIP